MAHIWLEKTLYHIHFHLKKNNNNLNKITVIYHTNKQCQTLPRMQRDQASQFPEFKNVENAKGFIS